MLTTMITPSVFARGFFSKKEESERTLQNHLVYHLTAKAVGDKLNKLYHVLFSF